jgi:hypothetical protein
MKEQETRVEWVVGETMAMSESCSPAVVPGHASSAKERTSLHVMAGLDPAIHLCPSVRLKMDTRVI